MRLSEKGTEIFLGIAVVVVIACVVWLLVPDYKEGEVLPDTTNLACESNCPSGCDCFFRNSVCRISRAC